MKGTIDRGIRFTQRGSPVCVNIAFPLRVEVLTVRDRTIMFGTRSSELISKMRILFSILMMLVLQTVLLMASNTLSDSMWMI